MRDIEIPWNLIGLAALVISGCFGVYEGVNWIGVPSQSITHGRIGVVYLEPAHSQPFVAGKVMGIMHIPDKWHEEIQTPEGDDWWTADSDPTWVKTDVCVRVLYSRSRLSRDFSASEIWREACAEQPQ